MRRRLAVAALLVAWAGVSAAPGLAPVARAAEFTMSTTATYTVEPDDGRVAVSVRVTFENTTPDPAGEFSVFNVVDLALQPGATDLAARDATGALVVTPTARDGYVQASVRPRQGVRYRDEATFTLRYTLPDGAPGGVRVRPSLVSFPVWGFGTSARVTVSLPGSYEVSLDGNEMTAERAASGWVLESGAIGDPANWLAQLVAVGEASHQTSTRAVPLADATVDLQVRAWTDDPAWGERTLELVSAALPLLEERLGVPYPEVGELVVEETVAGAQDLGGEPVPTGTHLQVGYDQPPFTVLHQLAHVWLADDLVAQRWIAEGFASWMAAGAAADLDVDPPFDPTARREDLSDDAFPLVSWGAGESTPGQDAFAYAASWAVAEEIAAAVGDDDMRLAWGRIAAGTSPYQPIGEGAPGPGVPSPARQPVDSRALLDHLEAVGEADLGELFERWVLDEETAGQLAARAEARAALDGLLAAAGDWGAPDPVTVDLAAWRFDSAEGRIHEALAWLADRDELMASAEAAGLSVPQRLRDRYRTAGGGDDARTELQAEAAVVDAYAAALARNAAPRGILERIGLLGGADPDDDLAEANRLFAEGDLRGAADATAEAGARLEQAATQGLLRIAAAVILVLGLLALALGLARRQRRRPAPFGSASDTDYTAAP